MATILITGGTGSLGKELVKLLLEDPGVDIIRIFSRDELKQYEMRKEFPSEKLRFFVGDVRDKERLDLACKDVDVVIHTAAMKQVPACEYNPFEAVKTNILGTENVIKACWENGVTHAVFISTDKAVDPINLYGATKLVAEKMWLNANGIGIPTFKVVRYGNVMGSRGSVIPLFEEQAASGVLTITDLEMTRFWITLPDAARFVLESMQKPEGVYIPDLKAARIVDLAKVIAPQARIRVTGVRQGEKIHETLGPGYVSNDPERLLSPQEVKKLYESLSGR